MDLGLKDKRALVMGASRGLGYATALLLAKEGCRVVINGRDEFEGQSRGGEDCQRNRRVRDRRRGRRERSSPAGKNHRAGRQVSSRTRSARHRRGGPPAGAFDSFDEATWEKAVNLSFMSHVRLIHAALPHLRKSKAASVLTMTSYSVKQPLPNLVLSNSVRLATIGLTKSLALELGSEGIRFNSILPATIETDRIRGTGNVPRPKEWHHARTGTRHRHAEKCFRAHWPTGGIRQRGGLPALARRILSHRRDAAR